MAPLTLIYGLGPNCQGSHALSIDWWIRKSKFIQHIEAKPILDGVCCVNMASERECEFQIVQIKPPNGTLSIGIQHQVLHKETWRFMDMAYPCMVGQVLLQKTKDQHSIIRVNIDLSATTWSLPVVVLQSFVHLTILQRPFNHDTLADSKSGRQLRICCGLFSKPWSIPRRLDVIYEEQ